MAQPIITRDQELVELCRRLAGAEVIAFDTEFVSERSYRPELCLVQIAAGDELVAIDTLAVRDLAPLWQLLADEGHETLVHAGRQETLFCLDAVGKPPARLFDVQVAAGMIGLEYPAGYGNLLNRLLGIDSPKHETRTDWRQRPLSERQLAYALDDVRHLLPLRRMLGQRLAELNRAAWFIEEMQLWLAEVHAARGDERWRRVAGSSGLARKNLAIVRTLWQWREQEAERRNCPVRQVLRDDLIVELARRRTADPKRIAAVRGLDRGDLKRALPEIARRIEEAMSLTEEQCPAIVRNESNSHLNMVGQFLSSALSSICRDADVAPSLVGSVGAVRELVAYQLTPPRQRPRELPQLMQGWRAEVVGHLMDDLLAGRVAIRIRDPNSEQPLAFERRSDG